MKKNRIGSYSYPTMLITFCFFIGLVAGSIWINLMAKEIQEQLGTFELTGLLNHSQPVMLSFGQIFPILIKREMAIIFLWLIGMTAFSLQGLSLVAVYGGFSMATVVSLMTLQMGIAGLPAYLLSIFPQVLFYSPVIAMLFFWGLETLKKNHIAGLVILLFMTFIGTMAEICFNPYFVQIINSIK
ncbi:MAG: hypothetical protein RSG54_09995 [Clostridium sp.]